MKFPRHPTLVSHLMEEEMKLRNRETSLSARQGIRVVFATVFLTIISLTGISHSAVAQQKTFASAEEAVKAARAAAKANDEKEMLAIFGAQAKDMISSGN